MLIKKSLSVQSRLLRKLQTPWETKLWHLLRGKRFYGLKFKRQVPIGKYIVDFCCQEKKIIMELDGGHHNENTAASADQKRQADLESYGYKVLRFWNNELDDNLEGVLETIRNSVE